MAISQSVTQKFIPNKKDVSYLSKDFSEFRQNLIEFAKAYYPSTYADFNEASPGMMFIEMAAYVGDVLSFYIDTQFKENLLLTAQERNNVIAISQALGYKPKLAAPATVEARMYQRVPALTTSPYDPDERFFLRVLRDSKFSSTNPEQTFSSIQDVDFSNPDRRTIQILTRNNGDGTPSSYVVSTPIILVAAETKTAEFSFGSAQKFSQIELPDPNVISIVNVTDSDGNIWYEVDYLGQDLIVEQRDISPRDADGYLLSGSMSTGSVAPNKLLQFKRKARRFTTRINNNLKMELSFGSGDNTLDENVAQLNQTQIANTKYNQQVSNTSIDPNDFLKSDMFGIAPSNTTLTVRYLIGGGIESNVPSGTITNVDSILVSNRAVDYPEAERADFAETVASVAILNDEPATGGGDVESVEEIRQNALAFFNAQNRVVTESDYIVRTLAMPSQFGKVAKVFVIRDEQINSVINEDSNELEVNNDNNPFNNRTYVTNPVAPNAINVYTLGLNADGKLTTLNSIVKQNLATYLEQYRMLTDEVFVADAFVINVGVEFNIIVYRSYNMQDVLARTIDKVKEFFNRNRWQINQPIILNDLKLTIGSTDGVQSVTDVRVFNKYRFKDGRDYQEYRYPIEEATIDEIIYPSLDPCIFEVRYPETDIIGNARQ
jgi:hypothetical protein